MVVRIDRLDVNGFYNPDKPLFTSAITGTLAGANNFSPIVETDTPIDHIGAMRYQSNLPSIGVGEHVGVGIGVNGSYKLMQPMLYSFLGTAKCYFDTNLLLEPMIGRCANALLSTSLGSDPNRCNNPYSVPIKQLSKTSAGMVEISWEQTFVLGNFENAETLSTNPLLFGVRVFCPVATAGVDSLSVSMSVRREEDLVRHFELGG